MGPTKGVGVTIKGTGSGNWINFGYSTRKDDGGSSETLGMAPGQEENFKEKGYFIQRKWAEVIVVQLLSCIQIFVIPWNATCQATLSATLSLSLLKFMFTESVMLSNHLHLCHHLLLPSIFPSIRVFSSESALCIRWPEYIQHQCFQWIFKVDFLWDWLIWYPLSSRDSQEFSPAPQFESINSSALSLLYGPA